MESTSAKNSQANLSLLARRRVPQPSPLLTNVAQRFACNAQERTPVRYRHPPLRATVSIDYAPLLSLTIPVAHRGSALKNRRFAARFAISPLLPSTSGEQLLSPTMLLSPVLSRPVRSQSAHSNGPFFITRSASACACPLQISSEFDEIGANRCPKISSRYNYTGEESPQNRTPPPLCHSPTLSSFYAHFSASNQATTKLHSLPGSGSFSRGQIHQLSRNCGHHNGQHTNTLLTNGTRFYGSHIHHSKYHQNKRGSISQHDSFESTGSAGSASLSLAAAHISGGRHSGTFTLPVSAASAVFLQRSHSDAQELKKYQQKIQKQASQQHQQPANCSSSCKNTRKHTLDNSQLNCSASGGGTNASIFGASAVAAAARQLDEHHLNRIRRMRRKVPQSIREKLNADGLNSSFESNSGASAFFSSSTTTMYCPNTTNIPNLAGITGNLHRLRYSPLGHSDPQLYTLTPVTSLTGYALQSGMLSCHSPHHYSPHRHSHKTSSGLLSYANMPSSSDSAAAGAGSSRRSFLSASPLTSSKSRKDSLLMSPRASIGGGALASGSTARRRLDLIQSSPSSSAAAGGPSTSSAAFSDRRHIARRSIGGDPSSTSSSAAIQGRIRLRSSTGAAHHLLPSASPGLAPIRQPVALRAGVPNQLAAPTNRENRRWSLASLPSSSGYGTPGSNSAFSSQYSSQEHLADVLMDLRVGGASQFGSNDSYSCAFDDTCVFGFRPRSRSLTSPMRLGSETGIESSPQVFSSVYKERFPKAKSQMESRLHEFLLANASLSGFTSSATALNLGLETNASAGGLSATSDSTNSFAGAAVPPPMHASSSVGKASPLAAAQQSSSLVGGDTATQPASGARRGGGGGHSRSVSPRPTSPLRPISPLAIGSATAGANCVVFRSVSPSPMPRTGGSATLGAADVSAPPSISPAASSQNLSVMDATNAATANFAARVNFSRGSIHSSGSVASNNSESTASGNFASSNRSHRSSFMIAAPGETLSLGEQSLLRLISDGATRFLHLQLCEICADCLLKSREDVLTCAYFCNMSVRLDETLAEAEVKVGPESYKYLAGLVRQILMIVSRTARLLECLEFDPDEFYQLLEEAEGTVREQLGCGSARVPDLPQYIISKLGLNKNLVVDETDSNPAMGGCADASLDDSDTATVACNSPAIAAAPNLRQRVSVAAPPLLEYADGSTTHTNEPIAGSVREAPHEEDYETIRLISNGAYGAVYLVRHRRTRMRFALKKMKKQTLLLRNQVDQVYAERDILTFTDNPFVVSFYGSFETRQHLCMLMEYVEGGDCAALLKSAGTLPIELARLYVAETVLAIEYLHSCGIVHRDLKPDNLLITTMGHIKLTDFGLSKIGLMNRTTLVSEGYLDDTRQFKDNQLCGTPEYIAPCVILRQGYGKPVDWWALGIILYEFLVGVVPFTGDSPEELFANIINEEVEYPDGDEALEPNAESLIRLLLEKNPVDRLGTAGGAVEVASHPFFATLDFATLLRQKAEFVPQLENEEDTSYFDSRADRYNHEADSGDDDAAPMFWSFSTASPRHSIVGSEIPSGSLANLQALADSSGAAAACGYDSSPLPPPQPPARRQSAFSAVRVTAPIESSVGESPEAKPGGSTTENQPIPTAVILRRRFSAARHTNLSTSSSGTTGPTQNTCSSTDSSMDASHFAAIEMEGANMAHRQNATIAAPLPRLAISPCAELDYIQRRSTASAMDGSVEYDSENMELPAVDENNRGGCGLLARNDKEKSVVKRASNEKRSSTSNMTRMPASPSSPSCRSNSLRVAIPQHHSGQKYSLSNSNSPPSASGGASTSYYHAFGSGGTGMSGEQISPASCQSTSSVSSMDGSLQQFPENAIPSTSSSSSAALIKTQQRGRSSSTINPQNLPSPPAIKHPQKAKSSISGSQQSKTITMRRGQQGYGFSIRSVRVYLSETSDYYTIEHIVSSVREPSPACEAGLRENDLISHVNGQSVHNLSHPQLMHRLLSAGVEIALQVVPLNSTSIREGEARRKVGKLLRKKPSYHYPHYHNHHRSSGATAPAVSKTRRVAGMEKKPRKSSALLRRLSGKRTTGDIVPGSSSQKQTFMPRSVSSQDGALAVSPAAMSTLPKTSQYLTTGDPAVSCGSVSSGPASPAMGSMSRTRSPVPQGGPVIRHHSSFKTIGSHLSAFHNPEITDGKLPPMNAVAFHQKRLSDFGIGCSPSSPSPTTSTTNSSLGSGDFLHLQPIGGNTNFSHHHHQHQSHQSPLVASSKSAPLPPIQQNSSLIKSHKHGPD